MKHNLNSLGLRGLVLVRPFLETCLHSKPGWLDFMPALLAVFCLQRAAATDAMSLDLQMPRLSDHSLRILSPNLLEMVLINTKQP